ncbi:MAG: hypothetical protein U9P72_04205 [Campylobacterota bacterium]|nr:hypothetical protein [Campylobacterota bacterium]
MRFTLIKDLKKDDSMRVVLLGLLVFIFFYLISDMFVKYNSFGISASMVELTLFGDEEEFLDPITQASFLEFIHTEIFFIMMILLTLSAVFIRLATRSKINIFLVNLTMISALVSLISLAFSFYISSFFINFYIVTFFMWHILSFYMSLYSLWQLK